MEITKDILIEKFTENERYKASNKEFLYAAMDFLKIQYQKTSCKRCLSDYWQMCREELGLINSAADESSFNETEHNCGWRYLLTKAVYWKQWKIDQDTPEDVIAEFIKHFRGYYERIPCPEDETHGEVIGIVGEPLGGTEEREILGEFEGHTLVPHPDIN